MSENDAHDREGELPVNGLDEPNDTEQAGVVRELAELSPQAIITEGGLARIFRRHQVSIKRAVQRGELPPPTRLFGEPVWTVGAIVRHLERRLEEAEQAERKFQKLRP